MRIEPDNKYCGYPCSMVGTGTAYEYITGNNFNFESPEGIYDDGYLPLENENRYIRKYLKVKKRQYFKRNERFPLSKFLQDYKGAACVCVYGHFLFADNGDYYSFFNNDDDPVVCIWFL